MPGPAHTRCRLRLKGLAALVFAVGWVSAPFGPAHSDEQAPWLHTPAPRRGERPDVVTARPTPARSDTFWYGGDDGSGTAFLDGVWDFDTVGSDPLQGWTSVDRTANPGVYFGYVTADSFFAHDDPCVPIQSGNAGMLWCGIHEDEADRRDFVAGMGYQNHMCQRAFSPAFPLDPALDAVDIAFTYFNHTEPDWDHTRVFVLGFDATDVLLEEVEIGAFDGVCGDPAAPLRYDPPGAELAAGALDPATATVCVELRMTSDQGYSDQDGLWDSPCGPFGADDVTIAIGAGQYAFDFEDGPQGWTFDRCEPVGSAMAVIGESQWLEWLDPEIACECRLADNVLGFVDLTGPHSPPGMIPGQKEVGLSGPVPHEGPGSSGIHEAVVTWDMYLNMPIPTGAHYRAGWTAYPYTTEVNPEPHWSPVSGPPLWHYSSYPQCEPFRVNLSASEPPLPPAWDSLKFALQVWCSCDAFGTPPSVCTAEGQTEGSPLIDNVRVGLVDTGETYGPIWTLIDGGTFYDGFGQSFPEYLEPSDRGDANIGYDLSIPDPEKNSWLGDSTVVVGPFVQSESARWLAQLCFRVARKGARQEMVPAYHAWKARLPGDPEQDFVCALMDSLETHEGTQIWRHKFGSYFHEDDPGFAHGFPDYSEAQEILPDGVFVPGTRIEYYVRTYWYDGGTPPTQFREGDVREFEILPTMELVAGEAFAVQWPSVLYLDAYNRGAERLVGPALDELGVTYDRFDYEGCATCFGAPFQRSYGGTTYNPGGYGNNGCTLEQLLGYRLILVNTGTFLPGSMHDEDFALFDAWLQSTVCGVGDLRRGLVFNGDGIADIIGSPIMGGAPDFAHEVLGFEPLTGYGLPEGSYRELNEDEAYCVYLKASQDAVFTPSLPGLALYGNGCPHVFDYTVLAPWPGVENVVGNLDFYSYQQTGLEERVHFAQVVRHRMVPGEANWRTAVDGFSWHHVTERGCLGEPCAVDSACIVAGIADLLAPQIAWLGDPADPFAPWRYPCVDTGVGPEPFPHPTGPVTRLQAAHPNPFHRYATIGFTTADRRRAELTVYDVAGRLVRTLFDGVTGPGPRDIVWDGLDQAGRRVEGGVYWVQLRTSSGYGSSKRVLILR